MKIHIEGVMNYKLYPNLQLVLAREGREMSRQGR